MPGYRVFVIGDQGRFVKSEAFEVVDDACAVNEAKRLAENRAFELWQRDRKIGKFDGRPS